MANAYGGITQYALQNWRYINKEKFQFDFATLSKTRLYFEDEVTAEGCRIFYISCYAEQDEKRFSDEVRKILAEGYDAVHLHTSYWKSFLVEKLAKEAGVRTIIVHAHNTSVLGGGEGRSAEIARHEQCVAALDETLATDFWACSKAAAKWLYGNSVPEEKIVIQKNAIDLDRFRYDPVAAQRMKAAPGWEDKFVIGHVGRFTYQKNHEFLARIFRTVHGQYPETRLLLVGMGPERVKIESMLAEWGISDAVQIVEKRNDVHVLMQAMDCFMFPSRFEGLPIVLVEAQAVGCTCLVSDAVTDEVALTDQISYLPLDEDKWTRALAERIEANAVRNNFGADQLHACGYDIKEQIRNIEKGYAARVGETADGNQ